MPPYCGLDFETRSGANLLVVGGHNYHTHHTTQTICCGYTRGGKYYMWWPEWVANILKKKSPDPPPWKKRRRKEYYSAWNAPFDRKHWQYVCTNDHDWPDTEIEDWVCTMSLARANGLPGGLENAAKALGIPQQKDTQGKRLIQALCVPKEAYKGFTYIENPTFIECPKLMLSMVEEYCPQDVKTEAGMIPSMRQFYPHELEEFWASEHINDTGIPIDVEFARKAVGYAEAETKVIQNQLSVLTNGGVEKHTQAARAKTWLMAGYEAYVTEEDKTRYRVVGETRISPDAVKMMSVYKDGKHKISLDGAIRNNILQAANDDGELLTPKARELIEILDLANKSSIAKYRKMADQAFEGVVYGSYSFCGAASTGRFSAKGVQTHNLGRKCVKDWASAKKALAEGMEDTQAIQTLSQMLRGTIQPEYQGHSLYWADLSNIEARVLPWLCDTPASRKVLDSIRASDADDTLDDIYVDNARKMGLFEINLPKGVTPRDLGKVAVLSLGFGGAKGALIRMAKNYGIELDTAWADRLVKLWRRANAWAEPFWVRVKNAAWAALENEGQKFTAGKLTYFYTSRTHNGKGTLWCQLPCKRLLAYIDPRLEWVPTPWDPNKDMLELTALKAAFKPKADEKEWPRYKVWYGVLIENAVQGVAASCLRHSLLMGVKESNNDRFIRLHTHDEALAEANHNAGPWLVKLLTTNAPWATELPLAADYDKGDYYGK